MDNLSKWTIILLSIQVTVMGLTISHLCYKLGYEQGRASVYQECADAPDAGVTYLPKPKEGKYK